MQKQVRVKEEKRSPKIHADTWHEIMFLNYQNMLQKFSIHIPH